MRARIFKWGNGLAVRLPKAAVEGLGVREGDAVDMAVEGDALLIRSASPRYRLEDLVAQITPDNQPEAIEYPPVGEE